MFVCPRFSSRARVGGDISVTRQGDAGFATVGGDGLAVGDCGHGVYFRCRGDVVHHFALAVAGFYQLEHGHCLTDAEDLRDSSLSWDVGFGVGVDGVPIKS